MRASIPLDGTWQARLDPGDTGHSEGWQLPEVKFDRVLSVPMPWQTADPLLRQYVGIIWYRRTFQVPAAWRGQAVELHFGEVDYDARVFVNGHDVGDHSGGYTPFVLDVTDYVHWAAENVVTLRVEDSADLDEIPHGKQGGSWYTRTSGPWQTVSLRTRPVEHIARLRCRTDVSPGLVRVRVTCDVIDDIAHDIDLEVLDPKTGRAIASAVGTVTRRNKHAWAEIAIPNPLAWTPEHPTVYTLHATLRNADVAELDVLDEQFGLRTIEARDGTLYLNGQPFFLRGALDQAIWPETLYTVPSDDQIEQEIHIAKAMGLNLLRKHIKPEDPRYLEAADRLGILIWAEPANPTCFTESARQALRRDLLEMIDRDFNHPSIIIWSLYNESWGLPELWNDPVQQAWLARLYAEVKAADPTRLICDNSGWAHVMTDLNDAHPYYAVPERIAHFRDRLHFILDHPEDTFAHGHTPRGEPVLISEFGNWGIADPNDARERSGGLEPAWFSFAEAYQQPAQTPRPSRTSPGDRMKTVAGFAERFQVLGFATMFESPADLTRHAQWRAFRALKAQIEEMRTRPRLQGYVVTELSDIEWEGNGWLDYWRRPKAFHGELIDVNGPVTLIATPTRHNVWGGDWVEIDLHVANTEAEELTGVASWRVQGTDLRGDIGVVAPPYRTTTMQRAVRFRAPADQARATRLEMQLPCPSARRLHTFAELAFAPRAAGMATGTPISVSGLDGVMVQRLERQGYDLRPRQPAVVVTTTLTQQHWSILNDGSRLLYLPMNSGAGADLAGLRFNALPIGGSWSMASGVGWARVDRLAPAPCRPDLGWEVAPIFPWQAIDAASLQQGDEQLAGWFESWLANAGAFIALRTVGKGRLLVSTFRFEEAYGLDPVATLLFNRLVTLLREEQ